MEIYLKFDTKALKYIIMCLPLHRFISKYNDNKEFYANLQIQLFKTKDSDEKPLFIKYESLAYQELYISDSEICRSCSHTCVYIMRKRQAVLIVQDERGGSQCL